MLHVAALLHFEIHKGEDGMLDMRGNRRARATKPWYGRVRVNLLRLSVTATLQRRGPE